MNNEPHVAQYHFPRGMADLTLRDYFAAKAMQAAIQAAWESHMDVPVRLAVMSYEYADAMLAERAK